MKKIIKHELVEVVIPIGTTLTRFQLPELNNLREVNLWGVQMYYKDIVSNSMISQRPVIDKSVFQTSFLTLVNYAGMEFLKQAPAVMFQTIENGVSGAMNVATGNFVNPSIQEKDFKVLAGQIVNYPKSYIEVSTSIPPQVFEQVFLFSLFYTDPKELVANPNTTTFRDKK